VVVAAAAHRWTAATVLPVVLAAVPATLMPVPVELAQVGKVTMVDQTRRTTAAQQPVAAALAPQVLRAVHLPAQAQAVVMVVRAPQAASAARASRMRAVVVVVERQAQAMARASVAQVAAAMAATARPHRRLQAQQTLVAAVAVEAAVRWALPVVQA
jgi:hypothetical protein